MQTNKERLIAALQEPLESTFATYKTSALGLVDDQVEENRDIYGENVITKGQEDSMIKRSTNPSSILYGDFVGHCAGFLHHQCLASKTR